MPRTPRQRPNWPTHGSPLVRRTSPAPPAAPPTTPATLPAGTAAGMSELVRACLLRSPQPDCLHVVRPGAAEGKELQKARATHLLEPSEELIAVWQWAKVMGMFSSTPNSLIFTSDGIRIAEGRLRLNIPYRAFSGCTFSYKYYPGGRSGPDVCELEIDGPMPWRSPNADQSAELIADDLSRIKELVRAFQGP